MKGRYVLTKEDFLAARKFERRDARSSWPVEIHRADVTEWVHLPDGEYVEVSFRCLIAEEVENLLFAGRCLSADQDARGGALRLTLHVDGRGSRNRRGHADQNGRQNKGFGWRCHTECHAGTRRPFYKVSCEIKQRYLIFGIS